MDNKTKDALMNACSLLSSSFVRIDLTTQIFQKYRAGITNEISKLTSIRSFLVETDKSGSSDLVKVCDALISLYQKVINSLQSRKSREKIVDFKDEAREHTNLVMEGKRLAENYFRKLQKAA